MTYERTLANSINALNFGAIAARIGKYTNNRLMTLRLQQ